MAIDFDLVADIEQEAKRAKSTSNASLFVLKDGEKALVRPLLNLNKCAPILKHDFFNNTTKKYEVSALCAETVELPGCKHCEAAKTNKKLTANKFYVVPLWVYSIKNADGQVVNWTDSEGKEQPISGLRYLILKASSDIMNTFVTMYRENIDISAQDLVIGRKGSGLDTKYTAIQRPPSTFSVENVPAQDADLIIARIAEINPPETLDNNSPAQSPAKSAVPDF